MSVGIPSANPAYSTESVLRAQLQGLTEPAPPPSPTAVTSSPSDAGSGLTTYNNLTSGAADGAHSGTLPAPSPPQNPATPYGQAAASPASGSSDAVGVSASTPGAPTTPGTLNAGISVQSGASQGSTNSTGVAANDAAAVTLATLSRGNTDAGHLSSFISQYA